MSKQLQYERIFCAVLPWKCSVPLCPLWAFHPVFWNRKKSLTIFRWFCRFFQRKNLFLYTGSTSQIRICSNTFRTVTKPTHPRRLFTKKDPAKMRSLTHSQDFVCYFLIFCLPLPPCDQLHLLFYFNNDLWRIIASGSFFFEYAQTGSLWVRFTRSAVKYLSQLANWLLSI